MSVAVGVEYRMEDGVESAGTGRSRQTHRDLLGRRRSALGHSSEKSKPYTFEQASLSETIRQAQLGDSAAFEKIYGFMRGACTRFVSGCCATRSRPKT